MPKLHIWTKEEAQQELAKRLQWSKSYRKNLENGWSENERRAYQVKPSTSSGTSPFNIFTTAPGGAGGDIDQSSSDITVSYIFKNLRFIHAQLSANPPSVVVRPASNDPEDRRKADAADRIVRFALRTYQLQEHIDRCSLNCLLYGTGFLKVRWDGEIGDVMGLDEETGQISMEGDIAVEEPSPWDIFPDPDASCWEDVRYLYHRVMLPYEEACFRYPSHKDTFDAMRGKALGSAGRTGLQETNFDGVELYEYWEKGLPYNGYLGRYAVCLADGQPVVPPRPNPHRFKHSRSKVEIAELPYVCLTDIDVPGSIWGRSFIDYTAPLQDTLNRLDSVNLDNVQAHGVARLVLPEGTEILDDSLTNTPWDVIRVTGNMPPFHVNAPTIMPQVAQLRQQMQMDIDALSGVNESMFGQQKRESSGFSMQYATNQGNMIRRRLFNKYVGAVEALYRNILKLVKTNWKTSKTVMVLGKEKAMEAVDIEGSDIDGGFDLVVEYGASLSLDPMTRREEILALQPMFEKAGVPTRVSLKLMKLNELDSMYDSLQMADDRQLEYFEKIIATAQYVAPEEMEDHENMLAFAMNYIMTTEFKYLPQETKVLIRQHIKDRGTQAAQEKGGLPPPGGPMPVGAPPQGPAGPLPPSAGMTGEQAAVPDLGALLGQPQ